MKIGSRRSGAWADAKMRAMFAGPTKARGHFGVLDFNLFSTWVAIMTSVSGSANFGM